MPTVFRCLALAGLLILTGCGSSNKGKIVGQWKNKVQFGGVPAGALWVEFAADGKVTWTPGREKPITGKYTLGSGDAVTLSDLDPPLGGKNTATVKVSIDENVMTWTEDSGTYYFSRVTN